jgi:cell wall-associated NlpC family hydrolase
VPPTKATAAAVAVVPSSSTIATGQSVWTNVAVATLWASIRSPRPVDAKAVSAPVDIRGWLAAMSTTSRLGLVGRVQTQALYGERLLVIGVRTGWLRVVAVGQLTRLDSRGYPGWVPTRQVTTTAPLSAASVATVIRPTAWLRNSGGRNVIEISIATRLPVASRSATTVTVATPTHAKLLIPSSYVAVRAPSVAAISRSEANVLATARKFLGLPYLWGGRSGFAVDCSGYTQLVYRLVGITIPRDTGDQATTGRAASLSSLRVGDLVLFREGSSISHVGLYAGGGLMLHAPHTGSTVRTASAGHPALARRLL